MRPPTRSYRAPLLSLPLREVTEHEATPWYRVPGSGCRYWRCSCGRIILRWFPQPTRPTHS